METVDDIVGNQNAGRQGSGGLINRRWDENEKTALSEAKSGRYGTSCGSAWWEQVRRQEQQLCDSVSKRCGRCEEEDFFWQACRAVQACTDQLRKELDRLGTAVGQDGLVGRSKEEERYIQSWQRLRLAWETVQVVLAWEEAGSEGLCLRRAATKHVMCPAAEQFDEEWLTEFQWNEVWWEGDEPPGIDASTLHQHWEYRTGEILLMSLRRRGRR